MSVDGEPASRWIETVQSSVPCGEPQRTTRVFCYGPVAGRRVSRDAVYPEFVGSWVERTNPIRCGRPQDSSMIDSQAINRVATETLRIGDVVTIERRRYAWSAH